MATPFGTRHRSSATWLTAVYIALVLYASLYPFDGWRWPPGQTLQSLAALPWPPWRDPDDAWINLAGYLPLGALLLIAVRRSGGPWWLGIMAGLLLPSALSYTMEVLQHFLPNRHPSLKDWALNSAGGAIGVVLGLVGQALGLHLRWHALRERWFSSDSAGALALLVLWPAALLFPAPAPLGLGQIAPRLQDLALAALDGVPWATAVHAGLQRPPSGIEIMSWSNEATISALGLLAPVLLLFAVMAPGARRLVAMAAVLALAVGGMTLSTLLNFGPRNALAWITPATLPAFAAALGLSLLLILSSRRLATALALMAFTGGVMLVAQVPADPYFGQNLAAWEQGRFVRLHGLAQWLGWLWPWAAMGWLLARLARRERPL
jgi:VanZ family protein